MDKGVRRPGFESATWPAPGPHAGQLPARTRSAFILFYYPLYFPLSAPAPHTPPLAHTHRPSMPALRCHKPSPQPLPSRPPPYRAGEFLRSVLCDTARVAPVRTVPCRVTSNPL